MSIHFYKTPETDDNFRFLGVFSLDEKLNKQNIIHERIRFILVYEGWQ